MKKHVETRPTSTVKDNCYFKNICQIKHPFILNLILIDVNMLHGIVRSQIRRILILIFIIRHSQEENSANGEQITESETDNYNENEGDAATTGGTDILTEGQPGWMEKLLKKAMKKVKVSLR